MPSVAIPPARRQIPARQYPLPDFSQEPAVIVVGERAGQRVPNPGMNNGYVGQPSNTQQQIAAINAQNASLANLEQARRVGERIDTILVRSSRVRLVAYINLSLPATVTVWRGG
jgi:hypothetical protein